MSENIQPVSVADLRNALALCKAKFETEAARYRDLASTQPPGAYVAQGVTTLEHSESFERMASSIGALLRAPNTQPIARNGKRIFYRIEQYIGAKWEDVAMRYDELSAARTMCLNAKGASGGLRIVECFEAERYREGVKQQ